MVPVLTVENRRKKPTEEIKNIRVGNDTRIESLTKCITSERRRGKTLHITCVGANSIARACKAIAESSEELMKQGMTPLSPVLEKHNTGKVDVIKFVCAI
ncbi:MAG: stage V sporulation protein S [Solibacillus isronensis]